MTPKELQALFIGLLVVAGVLVAPIFLHRFRKKLFPDADENEGGRARTELMALAARLRESAGKEEGPTEAQGRDGGGDTGPWDENTPGGQT